MGYTTLMVKKSRVKKSHKKSFLKALPDKSWFRFAVLGSIALIIGAFVFASSLSNPDKSGARKVADAFAEAFERCDVEAARKYYLPLQTNPDKEKDFTEGCRPGSQFTFVKQNKIPAAKDDPNNVGLIYSVTDPDGQKNEIMVYLIYVEEDKDWLVFSVTATSL